MNNDDGNIYYGVRIDNKGLKRDAEKSKSIISGIGDKSVATGARIDNTFKKLTSTFIALGGAFTLTELAKKVYTFAEEFNEKMNTVATISKTVTEDMEDFKKSVLELTTEIPISAAGAADALYQIVSAGKDGAEGMKVLEVSAKAAIAGVSTTAISADTLTTLLNAYKKSTEEAESISDELFTTIRLGKTTMSELGASIASVAPTAAAYGVEMEQLLAAVATLTKSGTPTAQAMTQIRSAILAVSDALGDGAFESRTLQESFAEVVRMAGGSESKLKMLIPRIEGLNAILGTTGINAKSAASDLEAMYSSTGASNEAYTKKMETSGAQFSLLSNNIMKAFSNLGDSVEENSEKVASALNEAFKTGEIEKFITAMGALIVMYGTYKATLLAVAAAEKLATVSKMAVQYLKMADALGIATANQIMFNRAVSANPYVLVAASLAAVVGLLYVYSQRATSAEKAQRSLNNEINEFNETQKKNRMQIESLISILKDENETTIAKIKAYQELKKLSPELTEAYTREGIATLESAKAQKLLNEQRDKAKYDTYITNLENAKKRVDKLNESIAQLSLDPRMSYALSANQNKLLDVQAYISELEKKIESYNSVKEEAEKEEVSKPVKEDTESYVLGIKEEANKLARESKNLQFKVEEAKVEAMEEGLDKTLAQNKLNYDKELAQLEWQKQDMIENIRKSELEKFKAANPDYKEKKLSFYSTAGLSTEELDNFNKLAKNASNKLVSSNKKALEDTLKEVRTYSQKYNDVLEEYENKREQMFEGGSLRENFTAENLNELANNEKIALQAIDQEFAAKEDTYTSWLSSIANMSLNQLRQALIEAQAALLTSNITGENLASTRAKIVKIKEEINNISSPDVEVKKEDLTSWTDLDKVLVDAKQSFTEIGDSVGGAFGEIIKTAGELSASTIKIISSITTIANSSVKSTAAAATGAAAAISTAEKASVILTAVSASIQIVTSLFSLFKKTDYLDVYNKKLESLNQELKELKVNLLLSSEESENIFGTDKWGKMIDSINAANQALLNYNDSLETITNRSRVDASEEIAKVFNLDTSAYKDYADAINDMQVQIKHSTWFSSAKSKSLGEVVPDLIQNGKINQEALKTFIDSDLFNTLSSENKTMLENMSSDWDLYQESIDSVRDSLKDVFGTLGDAITDSLVDAWKNPTEAALGYGETVSSMLESLAQQMVYSALVQPILDNASEQFEDITLSSKSDEEKFAAYSKILSSTISLAAGRQEEANKLLDVAKQTAADEGIGIFSADEESTRSSVSKGIATASQESVDENNGRLTFIQGEVAAIKSEIMIMSSTGGKILNSLYGIQENTSFCRKLEGIESTLDDINNRGLVIRK